MRKFCVNFVCVSVRCFRAVARKFAGARPNGNRRKSAVWKSHALADRSLAHFASSLASVANTFSQYVIACLRVVFLSLNGNLFATNFLRLSLMSFHQRSIHVCRQNKRMRALVRSHNRISNCVKYVRSRGAYRHIAQTGHQNWWVYSQTMAFALKCLFNAKW